MVEVDAAVVGAGVVGLSVAARLASPKRTVVVIERHERHGLESSSRNSEVVHAGLYYPPGTLKARLCFEGRRRLREFCGRHGIFELRTGKLVVAAEESEAPRLEELLARGRQNGVEGLELVDRRSIQGFAYGVSGAAALWSAESGIVDSEGLMRRLLAHAQEGGAIFLWKSELRGVEPGPGGYRLRFDGMGEAVLARAVVNAAGLHADRVAEMAGIGADEAGYRIHWFKGEYFAVKRELTVRPLVYPLPPAKGGLGIHLTVDREGGHRLGPSSFPVTSLDYSVDPAHREAFFEAGRRFLPDLAPDDLSPGTSGIRPKLSADGSFRDFVIAEETSRGLPGWVDLVGIESPGLTACLSIADFVGNLLELSSP